MAKPADWVLYVCTLAPPHSPPLTPLHSLPAPLFSLLRRWSSQGSLHTAASPAGETPLSHARACTLSLVRSLAHSLILTRSLTLTLTLSLSHSLTHSLTHSHSRIHSCTHSLKHPPSRSRTAGLHATVHTMRPHPQVEPAAVLQRQLHHLSVCGRVSVSVSRGV